MVTTEYIIPEEIPIISPILLGRDLLGENISIVSYSKNPVLTPGSLGCFDDNGVTPSCVLPLDENLLALYYIGWNPGSTVRDLYGGLALSKDNGLSFERYSKAPLLERSITDPYLNTAPWVSKFRMDIECIMSLELNGYTKIYPDII